jgi:CBS domain-containing protein
MFSQRIRQVMQGERLLTARGDTTVADAARQMVRRHTTAVVVVDGEAAVGIFTERDAVLRVIAEDRDPRTTRLDEAMTPNPLTLDPDQTFGRALALMHEHGIRHVPVVEHGRLVGIVSARDALDPDLEEFVVEAQRRRSLS